MYLLLFCGLYLCVTRVAARDLKNRQIGGVEDSCSMSGRELGQCVPLLQCRSLASQRSLRAVRRTLCGREGRAPKVCCASIDDDEDDKPSLITPTLAATDLPPPPDSRRKSQVAFSQECGRSKVSLTRIVGGAESALGSWPWMAVIYYIRKSGKSAECGGVLVTTRHVLTAAHCIVSSRRGIKMNPSQIIVRLGDHDIERDDEGGAPIDLSVSNIIKYHKFDLRTFQNDIAILVLTATVQYNKFISPICLPFNVFHGDSLASRNAFTAGWGTISYNGPASAKLREVQLTIWENSRCKEVFKSEVPITDSNLCAGDGSKDACRGDSGGPLMLTHTDGKFYLAGVVSFGKKCAEPGYPGVYTRISQYMDWLEKGIESTM